MNYKRIIAALCVLLSVMVSAGFVWNDDGGPIVKIATQLSAWADNYPPEKVYLQFDKPYYAAGDDMWFKGYVTIGGKHKLSALSGVLNVELLDDRDSIKQHLKLPLISGLTWGDIALSDTLAEGNYRIRAYTNYMLNNGGDYLFEKSIRIVNVSDNKVFTKTGYTFSTQNGEQKVTAIINYTDISGNPYPNKEVKYQVELNSKNIIRGKGITDDKGNLSLSFTDNQPAQARQGWITTRINLGGTEPVIKTVPIRATSADVSVQFFPEGGNFINGIYTKVAFKAVGTDGLGADIKGAVTDDQGNTVATFNTLHLGMGSFQITPLSSKTYTAHITLTDGSTKTIALPKATDDGYVLAIDNTDVNNLVVLIRASHNALAQNGNDTLLLVAQAGGNIYYASKGKPGVASFSASVPKSRFPSGIVQFTLFSSKGEPLNERLVFVQNPDLLNLSVSTGQPTYKPQQKVEIKLNAQNGDKKPVTGSFSVAVVDENKVPVDEADESTILSNLLLTSDLKGYVEKPNYYFTDVNPDTQAALDVLMLTQGYRRFEWKQVLNNNFPAVAHQPERTLQISGQVKTLWGKPVPKAKINMISTSKGVFFIDTIADNDGRFSFDHLVFNDSIKFVIQARTAKGGKGVSIELDNINGQRITGNKVAPDMEINLGNGLSAYMQNSKALYGEQAKYGLGNHVIRLTEVTIRDKKQPLKHSENLNGPGNADQVLNADQITPGCSTLEQCLSGHLVGVTFRNGVPYSIGNMNQPMKVYVDGAPLPAEFLSSMNMDDIASIEVLRTIMYTGIYNGPTLLINTKRGDEGYTFNQPAPGIAIYSPIGYAKIRTFYSPQYDDPKTNIPVADLRSTIYWNPNIITDKDGNAAFSYFNAGSPGTYRVTIEGIDNDGNIGRQVFKYKVE